MLRRSADDNSKHGLLTPRAWGPMMALTIQHASCSSAAAGTRRAARFGKRITFPIVFLCCAASFPFFQALARQAPLQASDVRPCPIGSQESAGGKKPAKPRKKNTGREETSSGAACLELHSSSLDLQENLQSFVRAQNWHVGDEQIGEAFLSFSMALTKDDLLSYANPDTAAGHVQWRSGKVVVLVKTADLRDGFARAIISAHFEGFGESDDAFAMQRASWTLHSNGKLETLLINGLQAHLRVNR